MFRKNRQYEEYKKTRAQRERENYAALTPTQQRIYDFINGSKMQFGDYDCRIESNGISVTCYVDVKVLDRNKDVTEQIEREIASKLRGEGLPCPPVHVHFLT